MLRPPQAETTSSYRGVFQATGFSSLHLPPPRPMPPLSEDPSGPRLSYLPTSSFLNLVHPPAANPSLRLPSLPLPGPRPALPLAMSYPHLNVPADPHAHSRPNEIFPFLLRRPPNSCNSTSWANATPVIQTQNLGINPECSVLFPTALPASLFRPPPLLRSLLHFP